MVEDERTSKQGEGSSASFEQGDSSSLDGFVVPDGEASQLMLVLIALVARDNQGVLYKGQELVHYRSALPEGLELMQVVFAWRVPNPVSCNG